MSNQDPDPRGEKKLDLDPHWNQCESRTLPLWFHFEPLLLLNFEMMRSRIPLFTVMTRSSFPRKCGSGTLLWRKNNKVTITQFTCFDCWLVFCSDFHTGSRPGPDTGWKQNKYKEQKNEWITVYSLWIVRHVWMKEGESNDRPNRCWKQERYLVGTGVPIWTINAWKKEWATY